MAGRDSASNIGSNRLFSDGHHADQHEPRIGPDLDAYHSDRLVWSPGDGHGRKLRGDVPNERCYATDLRVIYVERFRHREAYGDWAGGWDVCRNAGQHRNRIGDGGGGWKRFI